jgi:hypothetical protein
LQKTGIINFIGGIIMENVLHIKKGMVFDTETGTQEIIRPYGNCYIVHNYNENGIYTGASYLTYREIINRFSDITGKAYARIVFDK